MVEKQEAGPGQTGNGSETSSVKTLKDSSYSTATSSLASGAASNKPRSSETASAMRGGNDTEVIESLAFQGDCFVYFHTGSTNMFCNQAVAKGWAGKAVAHPVLWLL